MLSIIKGKAFVLGDDVDTDQIIPAQHLVYSLDDLGEKKFYGRFALSGVPGSQSGLPYGGIPFVGEQAFESGYAIIIAGKNFGCGSSREHAPAALQIAGTRAVIARSYARIFYRNAVDGGFLIPYESFEDLSKVVRTNDDIEIDRSANTFKNFTTGQQVQLKPLGDVADIVNAGGIFNYAKQTEMIKC